MFQQVLEEFDMLMEQVQQRRLAQMKDNRSESLVEEEEGQEEEEEQTRVEEEPAQPVSWSVIYI